MIIAISGYEANVADRVGIGRYAYEIVSKIYDLVMHDQKYSEVEIVVYLPTSPLSHMPKETNKWHYRLSPPKPFWNFCGFPFALFKSDPKPDIIFSPTHYIPRFTDIPQAFSIMDLSYEYFPNLFRKTDLYKLKLWTRYSAKHAKRIFTISNYSKDAIINLYHVPKKVVTVIYPGLTLFKSDVMIKNEISQKYNISGNYILSVGTLQPRKNFTRLIEAFQDFLSKNKQQFKNLELVIVGKKGWLYDDIISAPARYKLMGKVKFLEFVPDEDLVSLYKYALCFVLPSLYEGFGLPVLEAMAQGCPVVVSNSSSLPEIAGKAGIYVDPNDTQSIVKGLLAAVRERNLMQGKIRVKKGLLRVQDFSWDKAAKETLDSLIDLVKQQNI
jgi:glycosyltransferase involved in cell wall biosynthesis